jgi:4-hydroxybenzoate polyprenyltransferase
MECGRVGADAIRLRTALRRARAWKMDEHPATQRSRPVSSLLAMPSKPSTTDVRAVALTATGARSGALALVEAMRPKQWVKNVFVLAGVVFGGQLFDAAACLRACVCFVLFCAASSAVYLINDVFDRASDIHHPLKRLRPIASGRVPVAVAVATAIFCAAASMAGAAVLSGETLLVIMAYLALSAAYNSGLKRIFIVDVLVVSAGFVLRAVAGAAAVHAEISPWLVCCTFMLALYLALGKRRNELALLGEAARHHRRNLRSYSIPLLDNWLTALSGATVVCYALYTQSPRTVENFHTTNLLYTVPFVLYALFRYQHLVIRENEGGEPGSSLLRDRGMILAICGWAFVAALIVYAR